MPAYLPIDDGLTVGAQPSEAMLHALHADGYATIISVRTGVEDMQPIHPAEQGRLCEAIGLRFFHVPVSMRTADAGTVQAFREALDTARPTGRVFLHCKLGQRAAAMALLDQAHRHGWSAEHALQHADEHGYDLRSATLRAFVTRHL